MLWQKNRISGAAVRFLVAGTLTAIIFGAMLSLLYDFVKLNQNIALTVSYVFAVLLSFSANKFYVFKRGGGEGVHRQFAGYLAMTAVNYFIALVIANIVIMLSLPIVIVAVACPAITMFISYFSMSRLVFSEKDMSLPVFSATLPPVALLAGGLATRLRPVTEKIPKALIDMNGKPFIWHQLKLLSSKGVKHVVICSGYLGEQIEQYVRNGNDFGMKISFSYDGAKLLGTAGAVKNALPMLGDRFFVMYGDSYLDVDFSNIYNVFLSSGKPGLMTVFNNEDKWDTSNVVFENGEIKMYDKKIKAANMRFIDYGLLLFSGSCFNGISTEAPSDLTSIIKLLVSEGQMAGYEVTQRFYEIGTFDGIEETKKYLEAKR